MKSYYYISFVGGPITEAFTKQISFTDTSGQQWLWYLQLIRFVCISITYAQTSS